MDNICSMTMPNDHMEGLEVMELLLLLQLLQLQNVIYGEDGKGVKVKHRTILKRQIVKVIVNFWGMAFVMISTIIKTATMMVEI